MPQRQSTAHLLDLDNGSNHFLREQLTQDITRFERLLEQLRVGDNNQDFELQQAYLDMIHSRREMLANLPAQRTASA